MHLDGEIEDVPPGCVFLGSIVHLATGLPLWRECSWTQTTGP